MAGQRSDHGRHGRASVGHVLSLGSVCARIGESTLLVELELLTAQLVNSIGLALDALGVIVVFRYGWPQPDLSGNNWVIWGRDDTAPTSVAQQKFHKRMSVAGLVGLVCGFGVQIIATWMP